MSLSTEENFQKYSPSAGTTVYNFGIYYFDDTDIAVAIESSAGVVNNLTLGSGPNTFAIQATNGDRRQGAIITVNDLSIAGDLVTISRVVPTTQEYDLKAGAEINPTALNKGLDRIVAQVQQLDNDGLRHLTHPITDPTGLSYEAPTVVLRALKAAGWDVNGNVTALDLVSSGTIAVDANTGLSLTSNIISGKVDNATLEFIAGNFAVKNLGVGTAQLAAGAVTTAKLASPTGADTSVVTGTAGVNGQLAGWNADGDAVDSGFDVTDSDALGTSDTTLPTQGNVKAYVDASSTDGFAPTAYAGGESVTLPNGLVMKVGTETGTSGTVGFDTDFDAAIISLTISADFATNTTSSYDTKAVGGFNWQIGGGNGISWIAIGY